MKKKFIFCIILIAAVMLISSCAPAPAAIDSQPPEPTAAATATPTAAPTPAAATAKPVPVWKGVLNVYSFTNEVPEMCEEYVRLHPECGFTINTVIKSAMDRLYEPAVDKALKKGTVDIYCAEAEFVTKYTQGKMSGFAIPYEELGIDVESETGAAKTLNYIIGIGTRPYDNAVVGLSCKSTPGAFVYRRSIAKEVWGTDDPAVIKTKVGPGWDKFFAAAADLKAKGFCIVSGCGDIWRAAENSADKGWIVDGKLYIDPKREAYLDYAKQLIDNGYTNDTREYTVEWYNDMAGKGEKEVFGFFGPSWMINYVMPQGCGGREPGKGTYGDWAICEPPASFFRGGEWVLVSKALESDPAKKAAVGALIDWITLDCGKDGPQYAWANGALDIFSGTKGTVASGTAMEMSDGTLPFLSGQNMYDVFVPAGADIKGGNITLKDTVINDLWHDYVIKYAHGKCTREAAIAGFKKAVRRSLHIKAW